MVRWANRILTANRHLDWLAMSARLTNVTNTHGDRPRYSVHRNNISKQYLYRTLQPEDAEAKMS